MLSASTARPTRATALFGGTFDPIHRGHLHAAEEIIQHGMAEQVIFLPAGQPWQKSGTLTATAIERAAMITKSIAVNPQFQMSTREIERNGPTYTIDTVREFKSEFPAEDFVLLLGSDAFNSLATWRDYVELLQSIDLIIAIRPGEQLSKLEGAHVQVIESDMFDISSTIIRSAARIGADLSQFVPDVIVEEVRRIYGA